MMGDAWTKMSKDKRRRMHDAAREVVRGSIVEDATARLLAMCVAEAVEGTHERGSEFSKRICDPVVAQRIAMMRVRLLAMAQGAERSGEFTDDARWMRAEGVADLLYDAVELLEEIV